MPRQIGGEPPASLTSVLTFLDARSVDALSRKETRNREVYLPPVTVYRWWARRTAAVNGAILDSAAHHWPADKRALVADPMAGGGVIPLVALQRGHRVYAQDINPWAGYGMRVMLGLPPTESLRLAAADFLQAADGLAAEAYGTELSDGTPARVAHTFRVAAGACTACGHHQRLFPHGVVSVMQRKDRMDKGGNRYPEAFLACSAGHLFAGQWDEQARCPECSRTVQPGAAYQRKRQVRCAECGRAELLSDRAGALVWEPVLVERAGGGRRELGLPTEGERARASEDRWAPSRRLGAIPHGQETRVLLRHGFKSWNDLYPARQRAVTEALLDLVEGVDPSVRGALRMAVLGTTEMAGLCSRWDRWYMKSFESMAGHRFNFTTLTVEPNVVGTPEVGRGTLIRRLRSFEKAARWLETAQDRDVRVEEGTAEVLSLSDREVDLVLTDPPYHDDVQYSELSLPLRAWAGLPLGALVGEAVVNVVTGQNRGEGEYRDLLARIFGECRRVLKPEGHLVFSFANRDPTAWVEVFSALHAAGLRAIGYAVVHSENETDQSKRGVKSCTRDLILDLVPVSDRPLQVFRARPADDVEGRFLEAVGDAFLDVGGLSEGWESRFVETLKATAFLATGA